MSSRYALAIGLALLATVSMAALPGAAASTADDVTPAVDSGLAVTDEPPEDPLDLVCQFTPYPNAGYPDCVRRTIWSP
jgi:hypothetical protein